MRSVFTIHILYALVKLSSLVRLVRRSHTIFYLAPKPWFSIYSILSTSPTQQFVLQQAPSSHHHTHYNIFKLTNSTKYPSDGQDQIFTMAPQFNDADFAVLISCLKNSSTKLTPDFDKVAQECGLKGGRAA